MEKGFDKDRIRFQIMSFLHFGLTTWLYGVGYMTVCAKPKIQVTFSNISMTVRCH